MNKNIIVLQSTEYKLLLIGFTEWLQLLNYAALSLPGLTTAIRNFFKYQEENNKTSLAQLTATDANDFIIFLQNSIGVRTQKKLSNNHINKSIQALKLFSKYIRETRQNQTAFNIQRLEQEKNEPAWLTKDEIELLYDACSPPSGELEGASVLGIRDKAMLAIFYGCGLRLNEGAHIELNDINETTKLLHVRKGKHYKERFVPIASKDFEALQQYINHGRKILLLENQSTYLFIGSNKGVQMNKQSLYIRIKKLVTKSKLKKKVGTHTLRHSIATHLLQNGMKLERIQQFLGHATLDSTQIHTHLKNTIQ